jgi:hypothetical protein
MDESFAYFLKNFGPPIMKREVDQAAIARHERNLPGQLLQYWAEQGFAGYADGLFWTVDPAEYAAALALALAPTPFPGRDIYNVIARSAFGELFVWGKSGGSSLRLDPPHGQLLPSRASEILMRSGREALAVQGFFASKQKRSLDFHDEEDKPLFARALKKLGPLAADEMYGFEPAILLCGEAKLEHLAKVKILPHLQILLQFAPLKILENPFDKNPG